MGNIVQALKHARFALVERLRYASFSYVVGGVVASVAAVVVLFTATPAGQLLQSAAGAVVEAFAGQPPLDSQDVAATPAAEVAVLVAISTVLPGTVLPSPTLGASSSPLSVVPVASATPAPTGVVTGGSLGGSAAPAAAPSPAPTAGNSAPLSPPPLPIHPQSSGTPLLPPLPGAIASLLPSVSPTATIQTVLSSPTPTPGPRIVATLASLASTAPTRITTVASALHTL